MRWTSLLVLALFLASCQETPPYPRLREGDMFGPTGMRIHPIFTQVRDFNNDGTPDGIEVLIEFTDQFGDPTKATGRIIFELFEYEPYQPDPRGRRLANPWVGTLDTVSDQRQRWDRTSRSYSFPLAYPQVRQDVAYVLTASFDPGTGERLFDRVILHRPSPATAPSR